MVIDPDYSLYPSKEFQLKWLRIYLEEKTKVQGKSQGLMHFSIFTRQFHAVRENNYLNSISQDVLVSKK